LGEIYSQKVQVKFKKVLILISDIVLIWIEVRYVF